MADSFQSASPKVFISYAWKNQAVARQLQRDLQRDGVEVFVDYQQMLPGQSLPKRINDALKWCNTLVLVWSADSIESYWVTLEWENALALKKQIIPCLRDNTGLPAVLTRTLYLDFSSYETDYPQLCRTLGVEPLKAQPQEDGKAKTRGQAGRIATPTFVNIGRPVKYALIVLAAIGAIYFTQNLLKTSAMPKKKMQEATTTDSTGVADSVKSSPIRQNPTSANPAPRQKAPDVSSKNSSTRKLPPISLRSTPDENLSNDEVKTMLMRRNFFAKDSDWNKNFSNASGTGIDNDFELQHGGSVVYDKTTGLMWQQSGSENSMTYAEAEKYARELRLAGYNDWRLPTLEEGMSLMEPKEYGDLYIDPKFDRNQKYTWTTDKRTAGVAWAVGFGYGGCLDVLDGDSFVRAVR